jgi:hypothetical protein
MHSRFTPTCFDKSLPSSEGAWVTAEVTTIPWWWHECINKSYCFLEAFVGYFKTILQNLLRPTISNKPVNMSNKPKRRPSKNLQPTHICLQLKLLLTLSLLMSYTYMELLVKPEILTSYIYMDLRLATLKVVSLYLLHIVSTLNQCRKLSCGTVVCKHFASYQGYPNYRWDLIR